MRVRGTIVLLPLLLRPLVSLGCDLSVRRYVASELAPAASAGTLTPPIPRLSLDDPTLPLDFVTHDLDSGPYAQVTQGMNVGDIDGDGRIDLVVGGDQYLLWYHNPDWTPQVIAAGYKFAGGSAVAVRDFDGDGRLDVLSGRYVFDDPSTRETVWYANTPTGWVEHVFSRVAFCHDFAFGDLDGDGHLDAVCADIFRRAVAWLAGPADPTAEWTDHVIEDNRRVQGAAVADIDQDGRLDALSGRAWYRNEPDGTWTRHPYTTRADVADPRFDDYEKISVRDVDGDGRPDVFATLFADSREGETWAFLRPADPLAEPWTEVQVDAGPLFGVHSQSIADFDGSGRFAIMVGETNIGGFGFGPNPSPHIYVYRLLGPAAASTSWERVLVANRGTHEAQAVDLTGDGRPDVGGDEENTELIDPPRVGRVTWWESLGPVIPTTTTIPPGTPAAPTTTTSTLPAGCRDCDDGDPCTVDRCASGACVHEGTGLAGLACVCDRRSPPECAGDAVGTAVDARIARACAVLRRGPVKRRLATASRLFARAAAKLSRRARRVTPTCARALAELLDDVKRQSATVTGRPRRF